MVSHPYASVTHAHAHNAHIFVRWYAKSVYILLHYSTYIQFCIHSTCIYSYGRIQGKFKHDHIMNSWRTQMYEWNALFVSSHGRFYEAYSVLHYKTKVRKHRCMLGAKTPPKPTLRCSKPLNTEPSAGVDDRLSHLPKYISKKSVSVKCMVCLCDIHMRVDSLFVPSTYVSGLCLSATCVSSICVYSTCVSNICVYSICVSNICVYSTCVRSLYYRVNV